MSLLMKNHFRLLLKVNMMRVRALYDDSNLHEAHYSLSIIPDFQPTSCIYVVFSRYKFSVLNDSQEYFSEIPLIKFNEIQCI